MPLISIDFFGNLSKRPIFWRELLKNAKEEGFKVAVISGLWPKDLFAKLEFNGYIREIHYDNVYSILSHLSNKGLETTFDEAHDSWYSCNVGWWTAKAEICQKIGCQTHFDNDARFKLAFEDVTTRFVHTLRQNNARLINQWYNDLKLANTYEEWEDNYMSMMGGVVPM